MHNCRNSKTLGPKQPNKFFLESDSCTKLDNNSLVSKLLLDSELRASAGDEVDVDWDPPLEWDPESSRKFHQLLKAAGIEGLVMPDGRTRTDPSVMCDLNREVEEMTDMIERAEKSPVTLARACQEGNMELVGLLLDDFDVNEVTPEGDTPLIRAVNSGRIDIVKLLLANGAEVDLLGKKVESTALMEAANAGFSEIVAILLDHGARPDVQSSSGNTALHYAASTGQVECGRLLLAASASLPPVPTSSYRPSVPPAFSCESCTSSSSPEEMLDMQQQQLSPSSIGPLPWVSLIEMENENGHTALMEAASKGCVEVAALLIESGAGVNTYSHEFKESALTLASYKGHANMVKFLLEVGADLEHRTDEMHTPLMEAAMDGHVEVAKILLQHGAQVNMPHNSFESPLTLAACSGHTDLVSLLIGYGANVEEMNDEGFTPLMEAAREGHEATVALLLANEADPNVATQESQETALTLAACSGFVEVAKALLEYGADIEQASEGGRTPLMKAARAGNLDFVKLLVERGALIDRATKSNEHTTLSLACTGGHVKVVEFLLQQGANPLYRLKDGSTMVIEAARAGHTDVIKFLLDYPTSLDPYHHHHHTSPSQSQQLPNSHQFYPLPCQTQHHTSKHHSPQQKPLPPPPPPPPISSVPPPPILPLPSPSGYYQSPPGSSPQQQGFPSQFYGHHAPLLPIQQYPHHHHQHHQQPVSPNSNHHSHPPNSSSTQNPAGITEIALDDLLPVCYDTRNDEVLKHEKLFHQLRAFKVGNATALGAQEDMDAFSCVQDSPGASQRSPSTPPPHISGHQGSGGKQPRLTSEEEKTEMPPGSSKCLRRLRPHQNGVSPSSRLQPEPQSTGGGGQQEEEERLVNGGGTESGDEGTYHSAPPSPPPTHPRSPGDGTTTVALRDRDGTRVSPELDLPDAYTSVAHQFHPYSPFPPASLQDVGAIGDPYLPMRTSRLPKGGTHLPPSHLSSSGTTQQLSTCCCGAHHHSPQRLPMETGLAQQHSEFQQSRQLQRRFQPLPDLPTQGGNNRKRYSKHQVEDPSRRRHLAGSPTVGLTPPPPPPPPPHLPPSLLESGSPSSSTPPPSGTPSVEGLQDAHYEIDVNAYRESSLESALTLACAGGYVDLVRLLLSRGANVEHRDKKSSTGLHTATLQGHLPAVQVLLDHGADIEAQIERTKDTALSLACSNGKLEIVKELLFRGANKEHRNVSDYTPLSLAASGGFVEVIELLLEHNAEINSRTGSKLCISPLMLAAMNGHVEAVRLLLDKGSDINAQIETNKNTALTLACFQGRDEVVRLLVEKKANIEHRAKTGLTPLMEAASGGYTDVGRILITAGADVNAPPVPSSRDTALTIAADKGHAKFVNLLLEQKAHVDVRSKKGATPLWLSCAGGHYEVVVKLLQYSADANAMDNRKISCLMSAFRGGHVKIVKQLVRKVNQFPSDNDCIRYIQSLSETDMTTRCTSCMDLIVSAKEAQEAEANKNARILLAELSQERAEEDRRSAQLAKRREKKREKREKKKGKAEPCDRQSGEGREDDMEEEELRLQNGTGPIINGINTEGRVSPEGEKIAESRVSFTDVMYSAASYRQDSDDLENGSLSNPDSRECTPTDPSSTSNNKKKKKKRNVKSASTLPSSETKGSSSTSSSLHYDSGQSTSTSVQPTLNGLSTNSQPGLTKSSVPPFFQQSSVPISVNNKQSASPSSHNTMFQPTISSQSRASSSSASNVARSETSSSTSSASYTTAVGKRGLASKEAASVTTHPPSLLSLSSPTYTLGHIPDLDKDRGFAEALAADGGDHEAWCQLAEAKTVTQPLIQPLTKWTHVPKKGTRLLVASRDIGRVIGQSGCTVNLIREQTGAYIDIEGQKQGQYTDRVIHIKGSQIAVAKAKQIIEDLINKRTTGKEIMSEASPRRTTVASLTASLMSTPLMATAAAPGSLLLSGGVRKTASQVANKPLPIVKTPATAVPVNSNNNSVTGATPSFNSNWAGSIPATPCGGINYAKVAAAGVATKIVTTPSLTLSSMGKAGPHVSHKSALEANFPTITESIRFNQRSTFSSSGCPIAPADNDDWDEESPSTHQIVSASLSTCSQPSVDFETRVTEDVCAASTPIQSALTVNTTNAFNSRPPSPPASSGQESPIVQPPVASSAPIPDTTSPLGESGSSNKSFPRAPGSERSQHAQLGHQRSCATPAQSPQLDLSVSQQSSPPVTALSTGNPTAYPLSSSTGPSDWSPPALPLDVHSPINQMPANPSGADSFLEGNMEEDVDSEFTITSSAHETSQYDSMPTTVSSQSQPHGVTQQFPFMQPSNGTGNYTSWTNAVLQAQQYQQQHQQQRFDSVNELLDLPRVVGELNPSATSFQPRLSTPPPTRQMLLHDNLLRAMVSRFQSPQTVVPQTFPAQVGQVGQVGQTSGTRMAMVPNPVPNYQQQQHVYNQPMQPPQQIYKSPMMNRTDSGQYNVNPSSISNDANTNYSMPANQMASNIPPGGMQGPPSGSSAVPTPIGAERRRAVGSSMATACHHPSSNMGGVAPGMGVMRMPTGNQTYVASTIPQQSAQRSQGSAYASSMHHPPGHQQTPMMNPYQRQTMPLPQQPPPNASISGANWTGNMWSSNPPTTTQLAALALFQQQQSHFSQNPSQFSSQKAFTGHQNTPPSQISGGSLPQNQQPTYNWGRQQQQQQWNQTPSLNPLSQLDWSQNIDKNM